MACLYDVQPPPSPSPPLKKHRCPAKSSSFLSWPCPGRQQAKLNHLTSLFSLWEAGVQLHWHSTVLDQILALQTLQCHQSLHIQDCNTTRDRKSVANLIKDTTGWETVHMACQVLKGSISKSPSQDSSVPSIRKTLPPSTPCTASLST